MNNLLASLGVAAGLLWVACTPFHKTSNTTTGDPLHRLSAGNERFAAHHMKHPDQSARRIRETAAGQNPFAVIITCSDSRVPPEIIFDEGIGDLFTIRNAGNVVEQDDVLASVEYAVEHLGVHTVVVMGHERCGAIKAMTETEQGSAPGHIATILAQLRAEPEEQQALQSHKHGDELVHDCVLANVQHGVVALKKQLDQLPGHGKVAVVGALYDVQTGKVHFLNAPSPVH